jgi:hypothetical protein
MSYPHLQIALEAHGVTATADELAEYVAESVAQMEEGALVPAAAELPEAELALLRRGGFDVDGAPTPGEDPIARAAAAYAALLETALSIKAVAEALERNESRIRQRLLERSLIGIRRGRGWLLPLFQFQVEESGGQRVVRATVPGVERVFPHIAPGLHPVAVWRWFTTPNTELVPEDGDDPLSPRAWLEAGRRWDPVANLARNL